MDIPNISLYNTPNAYHKTFAQQDKSHKPQKVDDSNPISRKGESVNLVKATFVGGIALAGKLFWELMENGDFVFDEVAKKASDLVEKNKKEATRNRKFLYKIGAFVSLVAAGFAGFAMLYTAFKTPNIVYNSKVNTYTKSKEMDVYTKSNEAEKELYAQLADQAKNASREDKEHLQEQYLKMTNAKNQVPDFVKYKTKINDKTNKK